MAQEIVLKTIFQLKRGTQARWAEVNPVLNQGEPGFEYDTNKLKIGDGITPWLKLPYITDNVEVKGQSEMVNVLTYNDLPIQGDEKILYRVIEDKALYQWNSNTSIYESLSTGGSFDPTVITLINGGKANG